MRYHFKRALERAFGMLNIYLQLISSSSAMPNLDA